MVLGGHGAPEEQKEEYLTDDGASPTETQNKCKKITFLCNDFFGHIECSTETERGRGEIPSGSWCTDPVGEGGPVNHKERGEIELLPCPQRGREREKYWVRGSWGGGGGLVDLNYNGRGRGRRRGVDWVGGR